MKPTTLTIITYLLVLVGSISVVRADDQDASVSLSESEPTAASPAKWSLGLGVGRGAITGSGDEPFSNGVSSSLQLGYRLSSKLRLQLNGDYTSFARFQMDPAKTQQQSAITIGARWAPFESEVRPMGPQIDFSNVYLKGGLGIGHLSRTPYDTTNPFSAEHSRWGAAATVGLGWMPIRGPGYEFGIEASDSVVLYGDELRHNVGLNLLLNIDLF